MDPTSDLSLRVGRLEWQHGVVDERTKKNSNRLEVLERSDAVQETQIVEIHNDIKALKTTLDRLVWAIVGLALTIAGTAVGLALTLGAGGGPV